MIVVAFLFVIVSGVLYAGSGSPSPATALGYVLVELADGIAPTLTLIVVPETAVIGSATPSAGSPTLGYVCCVALLSASQVKVNEFVSIVTVSLVVKL